VTSSKYMVLDMVSGQSESNLSLEQAADILLAADGHTYEVRKSGGYFELWRSRFSANSTMGARDMVKCNALARSEAELWEWVVDGDFDWCGLTAYPQRQCHKMGLSCKS